MKQLDAVLGGAIVGVQRHDDTAPGFRMVELQLPQPLGVLAPDPRDRLGLHGAVDVVDHEVDLNARAQTPVEEIRVARAVRVVAAQLVEHPVLERLAEQLAAGLHRPPLGQEVHDADIAEVELRRGHDPPLRAPPVRREEPPQQRVLKELEVAADRLAGNAGVAGDGRVVDHVAVGQRCQTEEVGVGGQPPRQPLGGDLLLQVLGNVGIQQRKRTVRVVDGGQVAVIQQSDQIHAGPDFHRREAVQLTPFAATPEEIGLTPANLAGTGSAEGEADAAVLDEPVHGVEECRHLLHLVDHDEVPAVPALFVDQQLRVLQIAPVGLRAQQIDPGHVGKLGPEQGALARLPRSPEEERCRWIGPQLQQSRVFRHLYLNITCKTQSCNSI